MVEPHGQDILMDMGMSEALPSVVGEDHQIEVHADGDDFAHAVEIRQILGNVHRAA
jgi:hypothetical protein